jgi:hypothetical protein
MGQKQLTLWVDEAIWQECQDRHWHYTEVFVRGMEAYRNNPALLQRVNEQDAAITKLQAGLRRMWEEKAALEAQLKGV